MGEKGSKMSNESVLSAELVLEKLVGLDAITSKKMFGGHGIFHAGNMFGIVNAKGDVFLKSDENGAKKFVNAGGEKHSKMPYYGVTEDILQSEEFVDWAKASIALT